MFGFVSCLLVGADVDHHICLVRCGRYCFERPWLVQACLPEADLLVPLCDLLVPQCAFVMPACWFIIGVRPVAWASGCGCGCEVSTRMGLAAMHPACVASGHVCAQGRSLS